MENNGAKQPKKLKRVWQLLYIILTFGVLVVFGLLDDEVKNISDALEALNPSFLLLALGSMIVFWFAEGVLIHLIIKYLHGPIRLRSSLLISVIGQYYSALTPFASGGQPIQAIYLKRYGVPVGTSTSVLVMKFLLWQIGVLLVSGVAIIFNVGNPFSSGIAAVIVVGYVLNFIVLFAAVMAMYKPIFITRIGDTIVRFLVKIRIVKRPEKLYDKLHATLADYAHAMKTARELRGKIFVLLLGTLVEFFAYLGVTYFIYLAFGNTGQSYMYIVLLQSIIYVTVSFFPLPGASGASEGGFYLAFNSIFPSAQTYVAMLLWRGFTYYINIIVGAGMVLIDSILQARVKKRAGDFEG